MFAYACKYKYNCDKLVDEANQVNLKYVKDVNTTALETELIVFEYVFQENASQFDDILKVLKEVLP